MRAAPPPVLPRRDEARDAGLLIAAGSTAAGTVGGAGAGAACRMLLCWERMLEAPTEVAEASSCTEAGLFINPAAGEPPAGVCRRMRLASLGSLSHP